jgi:methyltransferase (TIGR00027 family)
MRRVHWRWVVVVVALLVCGVEAVEPGKPSKTSVWTAILRAIGASNPDAEFRNPDYLAEKFVGARERKLLADYPTDALDLPYAEAVRRLPDPLNVMTLHIRTRHVDATLLDALRGGARQVVVLGAGFDTRGFRFADELRGVTFIEVDYGPTQEYKKRRVKEVFGRLPRHIKYVPMDFAKDDLLRQLRKGGYDEKRKTLFIWEGVTRYIPEPAVLGTLRFVRDHAASGSTITFDYITTANLLLNSTSNQTAKWGEPFIFGFPENGAAAVVEREGLEVVEDLVGNALVQKYGMRADGTSSLPLPPRAGNRAGRPGEAVSGGYCTARVPLRPVRSQR